MKKKLLIFAVAGLALASCSSDETTASLATSGANEISFRALNNGVTRAANSTGVKSSFEVDDIINVYADHYVSAGATHTKYFQADFTKTSVCFSSEPKKFYWPSFASGDKLTFTAIWGATQVDGTAGQIASLEIPGNKDILVARHVSTTAETLPVLNFRHTLAQVIVKVKNTNPALKVTITDFQVGYVDKTGAFELDRTSTDEVVSTDYRQSTLDGASQDANVTLIPANKWANTAATAPTSNYSQNLGSNVVFTATNGGTVNDEVVVLGNPWILLPQTRDATSAAYVTTQSGTVSSSSVPDINKPYLALKMTIESYNGSATTGTLATERWCCWPVSITWVPGKKYTYTINVADGGYEPIDTDNDGALDPVLGSVIVFSPDCTVDNWVVSSSDVGM